MKSTFFVAALCAAGLAFAQAEPGVDETQEEPIEITEDDLELLDETMDEDSVASVEDETAEDKIETFLINQGWGTGGILQKPNGESFIVVTAVGDILAPVDDPNYPISRQNAFTSAMLQAKTQMAEFIETTLGSATRMVYNQSTDGISAPEKALAEAFVDMPVGTTIGNLFAKQQEAIDAKLKEEGVDIDALRAAGENEMANKLREPYEKVTAYVALSTQRQAMANAFVVGLQAFYTVEAINGNKGQIGVVALWSPKMNVLANAMIAEENFTKDSVVGLKPTLAEQVGELDTDTLLSSFGTRTAINERGELCLIAFGQSIATSSLSMAATVARTNARAEAQNQIRAFVGEMVAFANMASSSEAQVEFGKGAKAYTSSNENQMFWQSAAQALPISGITELKRWTAEHDVSGETIYGSICAWTPRGKLIANKLQAANEAQRERVEEAAEKARQRDNATSAERRAQKAREAARKRLQEQKQKKGRPAGRTDRFINSGAVGDEDAF